MAKSVQEERPDEPDWTSQRKAAPFNKLLGSTVRWADALPPKVRPRALMDKYPRLANMAAASWEIEKAFRDCLDLLLDARRGDAKDFRPKSLPSLKGSAITAFTVSFGSRRTRLSTSRFGSVP